MEWIIGAVVLYFLYSSGALQNIIATVAPSAAQQVAAPPATTTAVPPTMPVSTGVPAAITAIGTAVSGMTGSAGNSSNVLQVPAQGGAVAGLNPTPTGAVVPPLTNNLARNMSIRNLPYMR
jgi:hypothetical protein